MTISALPPMPAPPRSPLRARLVGLSLVLAALGSVLMPFADLPVARWAKTADLPSEVRRLINMAEVFGFGLSVGVLVLCMLALDRSWWQQTTSAADLVKKRLDFGRFLVATFAGGLVVNLIKMLVVRVRPRAADLAAINSVAETFQTACLTNPPGSRSDLAGFPSGHTAIAAGFAAALAWRYPHAGLLFACLACAAGIQRITSSAHYPSDVAFGAAIGLLVAALALRRES